MKTNQSQKNIPSDWQQVKLGDMCHIYDGTHQTPTYTESGIPFYSVEHVTANDFSDTKFISEDIYNSEIKRVKIEKGDILMTRIGDIGTTKYIDWAPKASFYVSLALIKCKKNVNSSFIDKVINSNYFQGELRARTLTVAFPNKINLGDISKCDLLFPPLPEQTRIVSVLETWDKAIENLNKKIEIKNQIKKGLMQDLLTGKKRLSGFKDKWDIYTLGSVCNLYQPKTITSADVKEFGEYKVYGANGVIGFYDKYNHENKEVIITCRGSTCGIINYTEPKCWITGNAMVATPKNNQLDKDYLFYILNFMNLKSVITGMAQPQITGKDLSPFKLKLPDIKEQNIIANILTFADKEITELERKLGIIKDQKKYLLNNLITGVIRTPENLLEKVK